MYPGYLRLSTRSLPFLAASALSALPSAEEVSVSNRIRSVSSRAIKKKHTLEPQVEIARY